MEQAIADNQYMTQEFVEARLVENKNSIDRMRNEMHKWTLKALNSGEIPQYAAIEIEDICGFNLTEEFELQVSVQYSVKVNAHNEEEAQNAIHDIDFDSVSCGEEITYLSSSISSIDI